MTTLAGKTALVTGASRGLGRASALKLAQAGAQVLVHFSSGAEEAERVVAEIRKGGGRADAVGVDLAAADGPHRLAKRTREIIGDRLDILIANAGVSKAATIEDTTVEDFDRLFAVNVRAPFFLVQQLLPILHEGSCIVFLSSLAARAVVGDHPRLRGDEGRNRHDGEAFRLRARRTAAFASTRSRRASSRPRCRTSPRRENGRNFALGMQTLKRIAQPDDIGGVVAFLASEEARWITGDIIHVDGGSKL